MNYTDEQLEALAATWDKGYPVERLGDSIGTPGPYAWMLGVLDDPDALEEQARRKNRPVLEIIREAPTRRTGGLIPQDTL